MFFHFSGFLFTCLTMFFHCLWPSASTFYIFLPLVILTMLHTLFRFSSLFDVSDHVFSLFWPSATTFYLFLTLVILTMLHSLFRFSSLLTCLTMFFHCFGPPLPLFIFFLPWSFWPCCTHFSGFLHFWRVWPCFFTVLALCYHFLYFSYRGHFDHVALTFQVFFTFYVSDHVFSLSLALCYQLLYFSYLGHFDHVALTFQVVSQCNQMLEHLCYHVAHIQVCVSNIKRVTATFCSTVLSSHFDQCFLHFLCVRPCFFTVLALCYHFLYFSYHWSFWSCCAHFSGCFTMQSDAWAPLLPCGTYSSLCEQY